METPKNSVEVLESLAPLIRRIAEGQSLSTDESEYVFNVLFNQDEEGFYWLALTLALHTKGETFDELFGLCKSIKNLFGPTVEHKYAIDISGTGGRSYSTFNVGTTTAFVLAGGGISVAKQGSTAVTGLTGSLDIMANLKIDLKYWSDAKKIIDTLEKVGVVIYHSFLRGGRPHTRPQYLEKMKKIGLTFVSPFHLVGSIPAPIEVGYRIYGCYSTKYQALLAGLLQKMGCNRGMIITGLDGTDEISITGSTNVLEFWGSKTKQYTITTEDIGMHQVDRDSLITISPKGNMLDFLRILYGVERGSKRNLVLANAAAGFYLTGITESLYKGTLLAEQIIDQGLAKEKLELLVKEVGDYSALLYWLAQAEIIP